MRLLEDSTGKRHSSEELTNALEYIAWRYRICQITLEVNEYEESEMWNRQTCITVDDTMSALFDLSIRGYDISRIDLYCGSHGRDCALYLKMRETEDFSSNIDETVMEKIGEIKFEKEGCVTNGVSF